jgi:hypothetical protein
MRWLVISESFSFSAFATATASYRPDHSLVGVLRYLGWVLPLVGMLLAASVYAAILAALRAVDSLKSQRDRMMAGLPSRLRIDLNSAQSRQQWWGGTCQPTQSLRFCSWPAHQGLAAMIPLDHGSYRFENVHPLKCGILRRLTLARSGPPHFCAHRNSANLLRPHRPRHPAWLRRPLPAHGNLPADFCDLCG